MNRIPKKYIPLLATSLVFLLLFAAASVYFDGFLSMFVIADLFSENAFLGIAALGMTLVIISGGIDLSVGSVVGFTSIFVAVMIGDYQWNPWLAWIVALMIGVSFGAAMGALIQFYELPAFLVTLGGLFFARGMAFYVKSESLQIEHPLYEDLANVAVPIGGGAELGMVSIIFLVLLIVVGVVAHWTRFGRNIYAIGGNEESALLMGLPIAQTKIAVYAISGALSAMAGIVMTMYLNSGNPTNATALELDAIAVVVIGGVLLSGGVGYVGGTLLGLLTYATIYQITYFASWRSSLATIAIGVLLLAFILLQRLLSRDRT